MILEGVSEVVIKESTKKIKNLISGYNYIANNEVVVGITEESNAAREDGVTNSQLLYLHEHGIPSHNVVPRPVLVPAISQDEVRDKISLMMKEGMKAALIDGSKDRAEVCFNKAGMLGRDACKNYITSGDKLAPNKESTIARKGSSLPLVDTGSMLGSITYAVRRKK